MQIFFHCVSWQLFNAAGSDHFQVWFWRSYLVHLWAGPWGLALWQRWHMPLPKIQGYFEGARCWERWVVSGLHCAGHLLCLPASYCLLCPPLQNQCREVDSKTATTLTRHLHPGKGEQRKRKWVVLSSVVPIGQKYTEQFRVLTYGALFCTMVQTWISIWIDRCNKYMYMWQPAVYTVISEFNSCPVLLWCTHGLYNILSAWLRWILSLINRI